MPLRIANLNTDKGESSVSQKSPECCRQTEEGSPTALLNDITWAPLRTVQDSFSKPHAKRQIKGQHHPVTGQLGCCLFFNTGGRVFFPGFTCPLRVAVFCCGTAFSAVFCFFVFLLNAMLLQNLRHSNNTIFKDFCGAHYCGYWVFNSD